jgi:hypothetical protein
MTDTETLETPEAEPLTQPAAPAPAQHQPKDDDRLEHAKNSIAHAVETVVEKVTDGLGSLTGRK